MPGVPTPTEEHFECCRCFLRWGGGCGPHAEYLSREVMYGMLAIWMRSP